MSPAIFSLPVMYAVVAFAPPPPILRSVPRLAQIVQSRSAPPPAHGVGPPALMDPDVGSWEPSEERSDAAGMIEVDVRHDDVGEVLGSDAEGAQARLYPVGVGRGGRLDEGRLLSGDEANTVLAVRQDEARIDELEEGIAREPPLRIEAAEITRLRAYKELVDRRVFPWRLLLSELEGMLADNVRLNRISPAPARGVRGMLVDLSGVARTKDAAFSLAEPLDAAPAFPNASPKSPSATGGREAVCGEGGFDRGEEVEGHHFCH